MIAARGEREDEVAGGSNLRRQRRQPVDVRLEVLQGLLTAHSDDQSGAAGTDDPQWTAGIDVVSRQRQRVEHRQPLAIVQLAADRRRALTDGDATVDSVATDLDMHDA